MFKKGLSVFAAFLIALTGLLQIPLSASAKAVDGSSAVAAENNDTDYTVPTEAATEAVIGAEEPTEAAELNYPVVKKIENLSSGVRLTWDTYKDNTIYRVYYRPAAVESDSWDEKYSEGSWKRLGEINGNSFVHSGVADGELGVYTVRCVDSLGFFTSDYDRYGWENRYFSAPEIASIGNTTEGVRLTWDRSAKAGDYGVYRRSGSDWVLLERTSDTRYTDLAVTSGEFYVYSLRILGSDDRSFASDRGSSQSVTFVAAPEITSIVNTDKGARITWSDSPGAAKYRLYYKNGTEWKRITEQSGSSYTDTSVSDGGTRMYTVRCIDSYGDFASDFYRTGWTNTYYKPPVVKSVTYNAGAYTVTWTGNPAFKAYRVFRRQPDSEALTLIADNVKGSTYTDTAAKKDKVYAYTLCGLDESGEAISGLAESSLYYKNGSKVSSAVAGGDGAYRFDGGEPDSGFYQENGVTYYYKDGKRVAQNWYKVKRYKAVYNRTKWLYELMLCSGEKPDVNSSDSKAVFELAKKRGIISSYSSGDYEASVNRLYVAHTLVKALGYKSRSVGTVSDSSDGDLSTIAYYGYFIPDDNNKLYPNAAVTADEFDNLVSELHLYRELHGRSLITFGDSIVYGSGNPISSNAWEGMSELIGKKYGMSYKDYSKPGAVMGKTDGKSHIADQVRKAISDGRKADLIIMNGGTNDVWHDDIALGNITSGYNMSSIGESNYSNGFEKTMWLITNQWTDTPVIYVRSHKMGLGSLSTQQKVGDRGLAIAAKWKAAGIDLYNRSSLDGTSRSMAERYTYDGDTKYRGIHPNALGYAKYYMPFISKSISSVVSDLFLGDVDRDGEVSAIDSAYLARHIAGVQVPVTDSDLKQGDVDGSGELEILDVTYIQRWLAGLPEPYDIGK